jgi:acetoin utilization protein AcuB
MRIRDVMTRNPITVDSETLILEALKIMKENNIRRLPVVESGRLVGIVTQKDLNEAAPAPTARTSAYEFHYFLSKMKVKEVMKRDPVTLRSDTPFEEALKIGKKNDISSFPVVDDGKLIGITTESDIVRFLTRVLGLEEEGTRITIEGLGGKLGGGLQRIISIADKNRAVLLSMLSLPRPEKNDWMIVLRLKTKKPDPLVNDFKKAGFDVTYVA